MTAGCSAAVRITTSSAPARTASAASRSSTQTIQRCSRSAMIPAAFARSAPSGRTTSASERKISIEQRPPSSRTSPVEPAFSAIRSAYWVTQRPAITGRCPQMATVSLGFTGSGCTGRSVILLRTPSATPGAAPTGGSSLRKRAVSSSKGSRAASMLHAPNLWTDVLADPGSRHPPAETSDCLHGIPVKCTDLDRHAGRRSSGLFAGRCPDHARR